MQNRNTPASISFGRRLAAAETAAFNAQRELAELKKNMPNAANMHAATIAGETIQAQRKNAKRMLAAHGTTLEDLNGIDPSILTPAYQEQLRLTKHSMMMAQELQSPLNFQFNSPQALQRFENFRQSSALASPTQKPLEASSPPAEVDTPFKRWDRQQRSIAGQQWNSKQYQAQQQRELDNIRHSRSTVKKSAGKNIGVTRDLSDM